MPNKPNFVERYYNDKGFRITSDYGKRDLGFHNGVDLGGVKRGTPFPSIVNGIVRFSGFDGSAKGYGHYIGIEDYKQHIHVFAHFDQRIAKRADLIKRGDIIGLMGDTGYSFGVHCHYQINFPGGGVRGANAFGNPRDYIYEEGDLYILDNAIIIGSDVDYFATHGLKARFKCGVFDLYGIKDAAKAKRIFICGNGTKITEELTKLGYKGEIVDLSGQNRYLTNINIWNLISKK